MLRKLTTWAWWRGALERALSQAAEAALAVILLHGTIVLTGLDWRALAAFAIGGAIWSIATSIVSLPEHDSGPVPYWQAVGWRLIRTFAAALAGAFALAATEQGLLDVVNFDWRGSINEIALIVVIAAIKVMLRKPTEAKTNTRHP